MNATTHGRKVVAHRNGDVSVNGTVVARIARRLQPAGRPGRYRAWWVVEDLDGNYVTKQATKALAKQAAAASYGGAR